MVSQGVNIYLGASSLRTCLGNKAETLVVMENGRSGLEYSSELGMFAGVADVEMLAGYTRYESLLIEQINGVLSDSGMLLSSDDVQLIISTTKGNVELLSGNCQNPDGRVYIYNSALALASYFNCARDPIVISNACVSGVSALVVAKDLLRAGKCKHVIVAGGDVLCAFISSGFASFRSVSKQPCRPYDAERDGLTLGEAAGAILLTTDIGFAAENYVCIAGGAVSNDANHISGPSRSGDGLYYAMTGALADAGIKGADVGFVNTHGTATVYNDEMESKAVAWAMLDDVPLNSLKGYIGHTLGASGIVETILSVEQLKRMVIFGTKGYEKSGVSNRLCISPKQQELKRPCCIKTASGFGGCNAAIVLDMSMRRHAPEWVLRKSRTVAEYVLPQSELPFAEFIRLEFKSLGCNNIKFYKMSDMSKALYVAVEHLLALDGLDDCEAQRRAIILANRASSLDADIAHQVIIDKRLPEGASPAVFVYTLPNVAAGEICIRHKIQGNNTFFIENEDSGFAEWYARYLIESNAADVAICGWCEYLSGKWDVSLKLLKCN